ncbi:MAG: DEAD/DEAH box helicase family protein, partial [Lentisphaerae bacterium]|nr:DEAD/DEAH box helicase family protein [Lentisphaerota bacterium]
MDNLAIGIYEQLLDEELQQQIDNAAPELKPILRKIDDEEAPYTYALFIKQILEQALRQTSPDEQRQLLNRLIELLSSQDKFDYLQRHKLLERQSNVLTEIKREAHPAPRPVTPLNSSALLTGQGGDPSLEHELRAEMASANEVYLLVSFIKWSGLRLLIPAFEQLTKRGVPVRIISTSYMGASDPAALEWLVKQPNIEIRLWYDTGGTRLHAKAYHFLRNSGFSTAYIGSANISHAAMTQGLEWTLKVTQQDMPHILDRFRAEFYTYWESREFEPFKLEDLPRFRKAINGYRLPEDRRPRFFADITPRPFQQRILEAIEASRSNNFKRNLVVAATGTGKTIIAALDYKRLCEVSQRRPKLLFVVHREQILEQALDCFRTVLRDQNFGELLVGGKAPSEWNHVFASIQSLNNQKPWLTYGSTHFEHIIVDEAHHGAAASYRPLFDHLQSETLLGLTATPERMDGSSILPDFDDRTTAEIRLPEALAEKLLCPFHYFGVSDKMDLSDGSFWVNG